MDYYNYQPMYDRDIKQIVNPLQNNSDGIDPSAGGPTFTLRSPHNNSQSPTPQMYRTAYPPMHSGGRYLRGGTAAASSGAPAEDYVLAYLYDMGASIWSNNAMLGWLTAFVGACIWLFSVYMIVIAIAPSLGRVPQSVRAGKIWPMLTQTTPLYVWIILAIVSVPLFSPNNGSNVPSALALAGPWAQIIVACLLIYYSFVNRRDCKQWLMLAAALVLLTYGVVKTQFLGNATTGIVAVLDQLVPFMLITVVILLIINHHVIMPKCPNRITK